MPSEKAKSPRYVDGKQVVEKPTAKQRKAMRDHTNNINDENREFWQIQALHELVHKNQHLTEEHRKALLEGGPELIKARIAEARKARNEGEIGEKQINHGKTAARESSTKASIAAREFTDYVDKLCKANERLSKTTAVTKAAKEKGIGISTAWKYIKAQKIL